MASPSTRSRATEAFCRAARLWNNRRTNAASWESDSNAVPRAPFQLAFSSARKVSNACWAPASVRSLTTSSRPRAANRFLACVLLPGKQHLNLGEVRLAGRHQRRGVHEHIRRRALDQIVPLRADVQVG